jgi:uncharacterized delta-60 repeat protein
MMRMNMTVRRWMLLGAVSIFCLMVGRGLSVPSGADAAFGRAGKERLGFWEATPSQSLAYPGNRILLSLQRSPTETILVRLRADGSFDRSFGRRGYITFDRSTNLLIEDVSVAPHGRILLTGGRFSPSNPARTSMVVMRLLPDGRRDRSFGNRGIDEIPAASTVVGTAVAAMRNGGVTVAGSADVVGRYEVLKPPFLARLGPRGRLDLSFGIGGKMSLNTSITDLLLGPSGSVLAASGGRAYSQLLRIRSDGTLDPRFGEGGAVLVQPSGLDSTEDFFGALEEIGVDSMGRILVVGNTLPETAPGKLSDAAAVVRYTAGGRLDRSFGSDGVANIAFPGKFFAGALAVQPSGRVFVAGHTFVDHEGSDFAVACLTPNGALDFRLGRGGRATVGVGGDDRANGVLLQSGGRIVLSGISQHNERSGGSYNQTALARLRLHRVR